MNKTKLNLLIIVATLFSGSIAEATRFRVAAWNTLNRPNNDEQQAWFRTVFQALGEETIDGVSRRLDVLAVSETDTGSAQDLVDLMNQLYGVSSYDVITSSSFGGDRTGIVYDTSSIHLMGSKELVTGLTHPIVRAQFSPLGTEDDIHFFVYSVHLKSGNYVTMRANEAEILRSDANALGDDKNIIYVGDFNMSGSSEVAWASMGEIGNGQAFDVAGSPGEWRDNVTFAALHTQNPGAAMDDRFDLMFVTQEMLDGTGIDYIADSYRVFGNNGTHVLNSTVDSGTGAPFNVLAALAKASDHLPIVADFVVIPEPSSLVLMLLDVIILSIFRASSRMDKRRSRCGLRLVGHGDQVKT